MSKSLKRVRAALSQAGLDALPIEMAHDTKTAEQAARAANCQIDQIAKSVVFRSEVSDKIVLFVTAGGNQVCMDRASALTGEPLGKADAELIRSQTGFAIGGVSPIGHLSPPSAFFDPRLLEFNTVWAAAGTPRHIFEIAPQLLMDLSGAKLGSFTVE